METLWICDWWEEVVSCQLSVVGLSVGVETLWICDCWDAWQHDKLNGTLLINELFLLNNIIEQHRNRLLRRDKFMGTLFEEVVGCRL